VPQCLVIAPSYADLTALQAVLAELGITATATTQLLVGAQLTTVPLDEFSFAVAVLPASAPDGVGIRRARGYREFADAEAGFSGWVAARPRATRDGPKAIFADGLAWLRERKVLLPGVTTLARLVASVRDESTRQMWEELARLPDPAQRRALDRLPEVPHGARVSDLERCAGARRRAAAASRSRSTWTRSPRSAVCYCAATLPLPVRHGDPAGAAQEDIGQSFASTRRKPSSLTRRSFHGGVPFARPYATTRETRFALFGIWRPGCFTGPSPMKQGPTGRKAGSSAARVLADPAARWPAARRPASFFGTLALPDAR
jgi:Domain of unknown function (DUF4158)